MNTHGVARTPEIYPPVSRQTSIEFGEAPCEAARMVGLREVVEPVQEQHHWLLVACGGEGVRVRNPTSNTLHPTPCTLHTLYPHPRVEG